MQEQHQHRTRHASLDFARSNKRLSPQEEWCEFLSASMLALTTEDDDEDVGSRSLGSLSGHHLMGVDSAFAAVNNNPVSLPSSKEPPSPEETRPGSASEKHPPQSGSARRGSFSESLTSSTGSSPGGAAWRPLGRRASGLSNQFEYRFEGFDVPVVSADSSNKLPHSSSFRDAINLSSSGSSLVESSSEDEDGAEGNTQDGDNNAIERAAAAAATRARIGSVDDSYAEACLPVLSTLPGAPRSINVDTRPSPVIHAKSPVLSNRKDSQTWQLQEEELLTSPRFGHFRASLDDKTLTMLGSGIGNLAENTSNQDDEFQEPHTRSTKELRASSVDFTFSRPHEINPPLPPAQDPIQRLQEPLQRLRARSFSYSAAYGSTNFSPAYKQFVPHPPQDYPSGIRPQEYPPSMRPYHSGVPPPPQPTPMSHAPMRPPRVNIPPDSPMHPYHQQSAGMPYRRYSTDLGMPPYPDNMMHAVERPIHGNPTGRGVRSQSVDYFQSNPRVRTHSLEGNQMFGSVATPVEYSSMGRHSSGTMTYEWPGSPLGNPPAPPLPPDARSTSANGQYPSPPPEAYYEIEFKRGRMELFAGNAGYNPGEFVKVEADRGEDIGRVVRRISDTTKLHSGGANADGPLVSDEGIGRSKRHDLPVKKVISVASPEECELLNEQRKEEHEVFEVCKSKVRQRLLPMNVIDAEYQFDRHKLTFFFEADRRIDFRELVRDLFAIYKTRIWLQQVVPSGKKLSSECEHN